MSDDHRVAPRHHDEHIDPELIVTWLDEPEDIPADERKRIEQHLTQCADCRQVAAEFRELVSALATLPEISPARSFGLTPEQAGIEEVTPPPPIPIRTPNRWYDRQMHALRWATAVAAVLFIVVLGVDLVTTRFDRPTAENSVALRSAQDSAAGGAEPPQSANESSFAQNDASATTSAAEAAVAPGAAATPAGAVAESGATAAANEEIAGAEPETEADAARQAEPSAEDETAKAETTPAPSTREERLRLIEFGLAAIFVWLLGLMIALPRLRRNRGNLS